MCDDIKRDGEKLRKAMLQNNNIEQTLIRLTNTLMRQQEIIMQEQKIILQVLENLNSY